MWPFRSTSHRLSELRRKRAAEDAAAVIADLQYGAVDVAVNVSADLSARTVTMAAGPIKLIWDRGTALARADEIRRAAEALPDEGVDITAQVNEEAKGD